jgi:hypothetical protein
LINRIRHQEGATPERTVADNTEREGEKLRVFIEKKTQDILAEHLFTEEGVPQEKEAYRVKEVACIGEEEIEKAIERCDFSQQEKAEVIKNPVLYEASEKTVNISIDDVNVKHQKEERKGNAKKPEEREYVHNTVVHIHRGGVSYTLNGFGVFSTLRILIAFLLHNDLLKNRLQFFVDGQKTLHAAIITAFSWLHNVGILLDWYHLEKKCKGELSMAMKGRTIRNTVLGQLMHLLWYGMVDKAIAYLTTLSEDWIKDRSHTECLIQYIERNRPYIPCYAVRKMLGLRNSSNRGEKENDLIVSHRQKHNGMSWSESGSVALATLSALKRNNEYKKWFEEGDLAFKLAA